MLEPSEPDVKDAINMGDAGEHAKIRPRRRGWWLRGKSRGKKVI